MIKLFLTTLFLALVFAATQSVNYAFADASPSPSPSAVMASPTPVVMPSSPGAAIGDVELLFQSIKAGQWSLVVALALMLLVYIARVLALPEIKNPSVLTWISAAMGVMAAFAVNLSAGESWLTALLSGLMLGSAASGLWGLVGGMLPTPPVQSLMVQRFSKKK